MTSVFTRDTQVSRRVNHRHHFEFSQKNPDLETRLLYLAPMIWAQ